MTIVLDASAMLALLQNEPGSESVAAALLESEGDVYAHLLNLIEVYYQYHRDFGEEFAEESLRQLTSGGVQVFTDMDSDLWHEAARLKSVWRRVSLADCFGLALAIRLDAEFLTGDRHELEPLAEAGIADITFIR